MEWQTVAAEKRRRQTAILDAALPNVKDTAIDSMIDLMLGHEDIATLTAHMARGEITAEAVTLSYIRRAITAHRQANCLSEPLFYDAIQQARSLDVHFSRTGQLMGPLHGIPISVKDQFNIKGVDTTLGYVGRSFKPATKHAALVSIIKKLGGIIITKTTIPQSILWGETESPLWGLTTHPNNSCLTPGGSSGGEAALLAMSGAVCGWGTDIGGSIRGPSHFCGLFGLKPSSSRFPYAGVPVSHEGQNHVPSSVGPMSRHLSTLIMMTKECLLARPWILDPNVIPLPWCEDTYLEVQKRPLKIGLILDDGIVRPHPEIQLAVTSTAALFEQAGHEIVAWDTSDHINCIRIMDQFYRADGGEDIRSEVEAGGEPLIPHVAALLDTAKPISVYEYWKLNQLKIAAQQAYNDKWNASSLLGETNDMAEARSVDILLGPVAPHTAVSHGMTCKWVGYTKIWNFLDYTAMSFPLARFSLDAVAGAHSVSEFRVAATATREEYQQCYAPRNAWDQWNQQLYDPKTMHDLPIGLQIIGRRFEEEKVLGVAAVLERLLQGRSRIATG